MAFTQTDASGGDFDFRRMLYQDKFDRRLPAYSRSGTAWWFGADRLLVPYPSNRPIRHFCPITGEPMGYFFHSGSHVNDCLHGRDLTNAVWVVSGGAVADVTKAKNAVGADGSANGATTLTFLGNLIGTKSVTAAANNGSGRTRLTIPNHGLVSDQTIKVSNVITAINGIRTVDRIDANTVDLRGTTHSGTYGGSGGTVTGVPSVMQSITDATARARLFMFAAKFKRLSLPAGSGTPLQMTCDGGFSWSRIDNQLARMGWTVFGQIMSFNLGVANQVNPKIGFACEKANVEIEVDFAQCVRDTSIPVPFFPATSSNTTLNAGECIISTAGKLVRKAGTLAVEHYRPFTTHDARTTNRANSVGIDMRLDSNNHVTIGVADPVNSSESNKQNFRYRTGGALQCDIKPNFQGWRMDEGVFVYNTNDFRAYENNAVAGSDTTGSLWASDGSGSIRFGDYCAIGRARMWPAVAAA